MDDLIMSYKSSLKAVRQLKQAIDDEQDKSLLSSMESDLVYTLEWIQVGRRPGIRRGIERRAAYQREKPMDPLLMQKYFASEEQGNSSNISAWELEKIACAISDLTNQEKEIYLMSRGQGITYKEIASMYVVTESTIKTNVRRAEQKIINHTKHCLICSSG